MRRIIIYSIIIFVFSMGIGYYYSKLWKENHAPNEEAITLKTENVIETTASLEEKISYDANLIFKKYYNECGHCKLNSVELPKEFVNLTKKEIEEIYPDWNIEEFSSKNLVIAQNIDKICDDHYVLKLGKENIEIYKMVEAEDFKLLTETNISKEYLTDSDIKELEEGIFVFGLSNLNSVLEDFE